MRTTVLHSRLAASAAAVVLAAGLTACGGGDEAEVGQNPPASSGEQPGTGAANASALTPAQYSDPFTGARAAAEHMPMTATALATGFAQAKKLDGVDTAAAKLRSDLTYLLSEHVYLAGIGINTALVAGATDAKTEAALEALDKNSVALADAVGQVGTTEDRDAFLQAWRGHIDDFVAYATAKDEAAEQKELDDLDAYRQSAGELFEKVTEDAISADAVATTLDTHVETLTAAIDAMKDGETSAYPRLYKAAEHMPKAAAALAQAFDKAGDVAGDPGAAGAKLRADLSGLLVGHVYMAGTAVFTAYTAEGGANGAAFTAAAQALGQNTADLTAAVKSVNADAEKQFDDAWKAHIDDFVAYAKAASTQDAAGKTKELADLDAYRANAGKLFQTASGGAIEADAVAESLKEHVQQLAGTIDALAVALVAK
ncbi:MAG: hypothetical protein ACT4QF_05785 [Sporichthyaceae bacterium]